MGFRGQPLAVADPLPAPTVAPQKPRHCQVMNTAPPTTIRHKSVLLRFQDTRGTPAYVQPKYGAALPAPREQWQEADSRSEEHTSELQSLMRISYAVFCLKKKKKNIKQQPTEKITK